MTFYTLKLYTESFKWIHNASFFIIHIFLNIYKKYKILSEKLKLNIIIVYQSLNTYTLRFPFNVEKLRCSNTQKENELLNETFNEPLKCTNLNILDKKFVWIEI